MPILSAVVDPRTASVELSLDAAAGVTAIMRADLNGTRPVRLERGTLPATGLLRVTDWEPALTGQVQYRIVHPTLTASVWTSLQGSELPRFILPSIPQFSVVVDAVSEYTAARVSRSLFHQVIGRTSPLVAEGRMELRSGTLTCVFGSYAAAKDLEDLLERGQSVLYRQWEHPGMDMYFHSESLRVTPDPETGDWTLVIDYREVSFPPGDVQSSSSWTFDALAAKYKTFEDVTAAYGSFHDLTIGETL